MLNETQFDCITRKQNNYNESKKLINLYIFNNAIFQRKHAKRNILMFHSKDTNTSLFNKT